MININGSVYYIFLFLKRTNTFLFQINLATFSLLQLCYWLIWNVFFELSVFWHIFLFVCFNSNFLAVNKKIRYLLWYMSGQVDKFLHPRDAKYHLCNMLKAKFRCEIHQLKLLSRQILGLRLVLYQNVCPRNGFFYPIEKRSSIIARNVIGVFT